jgi:hypothetical protein
VQHLLFPGGGSDGDGEVGDGEVRGLSSDGGPETELLAKLDGMNHKDASLVVAMKISLGMDKLNATMKLALARMDKVCHLIPPTEEIHWNIQTWA